MELFGKTTTNGGKPQENDGYKKAVVKMVDERTLGVPLEHH
jgi:hypothetical protein